MLVDFLEHERDIRPSDVPVALEQRVRVVVKRASVGMVKLGEVIIPAVNDDGAISDRACAESCGWSSTNGLREPECNETDTSHENRNNTEKPHLLSPSTLLFGRADTCGKALLLA